MYHVFVVNDVTFKYHLEYLFAGTCALQNPDFLEDSEYRNPSNKNDGVTPKQELSICGMIADVSRIRPGDKVIFYLTQTTELEGMFFGIFVVKGLAFFDLNDGNYLSPQLGVNLNFRVILSPDKVYARGVSEREALDSLRGITHPSQMCWSMIYRKLKGKRGCTMITDYEAYRLVNLIKKANNGRELKSKCFTYDNELNQITSNEQRNPYRGTKCDLDVKDRMLVKAERQNKYEAHLQAYVLQHIDKKPLKDLLNVDTNVPVWIGNEVSCGVGMQSIDIMTQQCGKKDIYINVIELKCVEPYDDILDKQLPKYENWILDYISPLYQEKHVHIRPIIIAKLFGRKEQTGCFVQKCQKIKSYTTGNTTVEPVCYIGYTIDEDIKFTKLV